MGINGLWDVLGEGEVWHIADYAAKHFKEHKRPLRIAVDEATWRFTNLTPEQVEKIREGEPAANPVEKTILWRILRLWRLNIQLLFVYDGLRKPGKSRRNGRGGGKVDQDCIKLLHRMFGLLKVPYHQAPGEAEAECAKLQRLGIVDAVWSDDGDSFMFGCSTLIKAQKVGGKRVDDHIRVYRSSMLAEKLDFDADSLVLFALLAGGDYDTTGLRGCGPVNAARVCRRSFGLAKRIVNITPAQMGMWRHDLGQALRDQIPPDFPTLKVLNGYRTPAVSTDEACRDLRSLRGGWVKTIDQQNLRSELRYHYNFTTREYLKHLGPVFLSRALADAITPFWKNDNIRFNVHLKSNIRRKDEAGNPTKCEVKIMYSAHELVKIDLSAQPEDEDWSKFAAKDGTPYDPRHKIECEMLECLLGHGLPAGSWDPPVKAKKGKHKAADNHGSDDETSEARISPGKENKAPTKKRGRPPKDPSEQSTSQPAKKKRKSKSAEGKSPSPPPSTFRLLEIPDLPSSSRVVDLLDEDEDEDDRDVGLSLSLPSSAPSQLPNKKATPAKRPPKFRPLSPKRGAKDVQNAATTAAVAKTKSAFSKSKTAAQKPSSRSTPQRAQDDGMASRTLQGKSLSAVPQSAFPKPAISRPARPAMSHPAMSHSAMSPPAMPQPTTVYKSPQQLQSSPSELLPGQVIDPRTLRELRLAALQGSVVGASPAPQALKPQPRTTAPSLVIDLT